MKNIIYCNAVHHGNESVWEFLWHQYATSNVATEKSTILKALACSREPWLLYRYLEWAVLGSSSSSGIRKQDVPSVLVTVIENSVGYHVAKKFLEENITELFNR